MTGPISLRRARPPPVPPLRSTSSPCKSSRPACRADGNVKFRSECRPCRKAYQHEWYLAHREDCSGGGGRPASREKAAYRFGTTPEPTAPPRGRRLPGSWQHPHARRRWPRDRNRLLLPHRRQGRYPAHRQPAIRPHGGRRASSCSRVQVRTTTVREGRSYVVGLKTVGGNKTQVITKVFDPKAYEWLFVVCGDATAYLIPDDGHHGPVQHLPRPEVRALPARGLRAGDRNRTGIVWLETRGPTVERRPQR